MIALFVILGIVAIFGITINAIEARRHDQFLQYSRFDRDSRLAVQPLDFADIDFADDYIMCNCDGVGMCSSHIDDMLADMDAVDTFGAIFGSGDDTGYDGASSPSDFWNNYSSPTPVDDYIAEQSAYQNDSIFNDDDQ